MNQTTLDFGGGRAARDSDPRTLARRNNPSTSHEAAARVVASGRAATHEAVVLHYVRTLPDHTSAEIAAIIPFQHGIDLTECRRRLTGLLQKGKVVQGPARTCRVKGTRMVTWAVVE